MQGGRSGHTRHDAKTRHQTTDAPKRAQSQADGGQTIIVVTIRGQRVGLETVLQTNAGKNNGVDSVHNGTEYRAHGQQGDPESGPGGRRGLPDQQSGQIFLGQQGIVVHVL